jgi:hypothetical protein
MSPPRRPPAMAPQRQPMLPDPIEGIFDDGGMGMGPNEEDRLAAWIEDLWTQGPCARLELAQVVGGGGTCPVRDWAEELEGLDPSSIANEIMASANEDCESSGQFSRYCVMASRPGAASYFRRFYFTLQAPPIDQAGFSSEFGAEGLVSAAHRHVEQIMRIGLGSAAASLRSIIMQNHELSGLARSAWTAQAEAAAAREKLMDRDMERSMLMKKQSAVQDRHERMMRWAETLATTIGVPTLMHRMGAPPALVAHAAAIGQAMLGAPGAPSLVAPPPQAPTQQQPAQINISSPEDLALVRQVVATIVPLLAATPDASLGMLLARLPADEQETVRAVRDRANAQGDGQPMTEADKPLMAQFAGVVCHLVGEVLGDVELGMHVGPLDDAARTAVLRLRDVLRAKTAAAPTNGTATTSPVTKSTNGAPSPAGAPS